MGFYLVSCGDSSWSACCMVGDQGSIAPAAEFQDNLKCMKTFIAVGWIIYPIGFLLVLSGNESIREIAYNVVDVINKVGFGVRCDRGQTLLPWSKANFSSLNLVS